MPAPNKRAARPRRRQFDARVHERNNREQAERILADPHAPAGMIEWAELVLDRLAREGGGQ